MAQPEPFSPVKLVCGIIASGDAVFDRAVPLLEEMFGPADAWSPRYVFDLTDYYVKQMGPGLARMFLSFERLVWPEDLSEIKLRTNALEAKIQFDLHENKRVINLDPGTLTSASLIMATTKDFSHRIPLQKGIYAHLEFLFHKNGLEALPWTYPDFRGDKYRDFFLRVRKIYSSQLLRNDERGPAA
jgi:hypothetical protein